MLTLAVVVAHPDDDAYGIAGTVALHLDDEEFRFVLVHATDGEGGDIRPGFPATPETLGAVRRAEDEAGWRAVGRAPDRHVWLGYPDGEVGRVPFDELVEAVWSVLEEEQPTVVFTFGPDGIFGHPDHIAIGAATDAAFARAASSSGTAFRRLLHGAVPESAFSRWNEQRAAQGRWVFDPTATYHMRGVPDAEIGVAVDCRPVASRIVAGLREHRSQHHVFIDDADDVARWERIVTREWHVIAWPPREPGAATLGDVFEGLE
ncbi:PIG-L deacetylase family protein [Nocardioides zhouii]|uniref:PIG-L family deacetylase n=1 Tax=Nocardioides zhouii TaxID=1168729 RepID=A0A4Q2SYM9_9ACTN|nr:PIG-L family deacetylase [Nocardioides zhouii]RYC10591.1 PIG-L family deacetylase [Nocardioides zhouii]